MKVQVISLNKLLINLFIFFINECILHRSCMEALV